MYGADSSSASSKYGADSSLAGTRYGADTSRGIAAMNDTTNLRGQDQSYNLGLTRNETDRFNADTNATNTRNQFDLGKLRNEQEAQNARNQYDLGLGRNAVDAQNSNTNASDSIYRTQLASDRNAIDRQSRIDNLGLGQGKLQQEATDSDRRYDSQLRDSDYRYAALDSENYQRNFNNQVTGVNMGMNAQERLQANNAQGVAAGTAMQNTPLDYYKTFTNTANAVGNGYGTESESKSTQGNPYVSALGGAQLGSQFAKNLGFGSAPAVTDGGYAVGQGSAYGSTRRGM